MFRRILQTIKYSIFPSKCLACGMFFHPHPDIAPGKDVFSQMVHGPAERVFCRAMAPFLCSSCVTEFSPIQPPLCTQCGRMFDSRSGTNHQCGLCIQHPPACRTIRSAGIYNGALKSNIHALKFKHNVHLARPLGRLLFSSFMQYYDSNAIDSIIPVPLHSSRLKQRGFNQAALLIQEWPSLIKQTNQTDSEHFVDITDNNLVRNRKTVSQTGLGKDSRKRNVKGAFAVTDSSRISGKRILLVDDVFTTGSTVNECAKTLIRGGAANVSVLTLARAN